MLRYVPKEQVPSDLLTPFFVQYSSDFENRQAEKFVPSFIDFYRRAVSNVRFKPLVVKLKAALIDLLTNAGNQEKVQSVLDGICELQLGISRKLYLLETDSVELIMSILSSDLMRFNIEGVSEQLQFLAADIIDLFIVFRHHEQLPDLEKAREMALTFEAVVEDALLDVPTIDELEKKRILDDLRRLWTLVPCSMAGSFAAKMNLLLNAAAPPQA
jgi:hypothetical protein